MQMQHLTDAQSRYWAKNQELCPELDALWTLEPQMGNSFVTDVLRKAKERTLSPKQADALTRCYYGYMKFQAAQEERAAKYADADHIGEEGCGITFSGTVTLVKEFDGRYGPSKLVKWDTDDGNIVLTFSTARWTHLISEGEHCECSGEVKRHKEYNGIPETQVTRVKVLRTS